MPESFRQIDISRSIRLLRSTPYVQTIYGVMVPKHATSRKGDLLYCYEADQGILVYIPARLVDE